MSSTGVNISIKNCYLVQGPQNKDYVVYAVEIRTARYMWTVFRRFTAFQRLYNILLQEGVPNVTPCPDKVMIYSNSGAALDQRRQELEGWLRELLQNPYVQHVAAFQEFMRAEANIAPPNIKQVNLEYKPEIQQPAAPSNFPNDQFQDIKDDNKTITVKDFEILKVIGKGSFGKVFQVRKKDSGKIYAMKVLKKSCIEKKHQIEHTKTERNILGKVSHPFIVNLNYAFQTRDKLYFILDFCSGGELFYHLGKERKFTEERSKFYAAEITLALEHLHRYGVIYRDLKPENVLLTEEGHVALTDFGLSKEGVDSPFTGAKSFCGTPEYLAPEVLNRTGHGKAVDWWSLGALLYEMLTGWPPFYSKDQERLFNKIKKAPLEIPANIPAEASDLLTKLLERDVTKRLGSGPTDAEEIKNHPFFKNIDWKKLYLKEVPVPWCPQVSNASDTSQFSNEFTSLPIVSPSSLQASLHGDIKFDGFSYASSLINEMNKIENEDAIDSNEDLSLSDEEEDEEDDNIDNEEDEDEMAMDKEDEEDEETISGSYYDNYDYDSHMSVDNY
ncbi:hypothetical protein WA158_003739 [Blastocystis sp. Blastoise]